MSALMQSVSPARLSQSDSVVSTPQIEEVEALKAELSAARMELEESRSQQNSPDKSDPRLTQALDEVERLKEAEGTLKTLYQMSKSQCEALLEQVESDTQDEQAKLAAAQQAAAAAKPNKLQKPATMKNNASM